MVNGRLKGDSSCAGACLIPVLDWRSAKLVAGTVVRETETKTRTAYKMGEQLIVVCLRDSVSSFRSGLKNELVFLLLLNRWTGNLWLTYGHRINQWNKRNCIFQSDFYLFRENDFVTLGFFVSSTILTWMGFCGREDIKIYINFVYRVTIMSYDTLKHCLPKTHFYNTC